MKMQIHRQLGEAAKSGDLKRFNRLLAKMERQVSNLPSDFQIESPASELLDLEIANSDDSIQAERDDFERDATRAVAGWFARMPLQTLDAADNAVLAVAHCHIELSQENIDRLVDAARGNYQLARLYIFDFLRKRCSTSQACADAWRTLASDRQASVRCAALCLLDQQVPAALSSELIRAALADRSARVRNWGVEMTDRLELVDLLPELEQLRKHEKAKSVLEGLALHIPRIRNLKSRKRRGQKARSALRS